MILVDKFIHQRDIVNRGKRVIQVVLQQYSQIWTPCKTFCKYVSPKGAQNGSLSVLHFHWSGRICAVYESILHLLCLRGETTGIAWASSSTCLKLESLRTTRTRRRQRQVKKEDTWEGSRALLLPEGREGGKSV